VTPALRLRGISKRFGTLVANDDISLDLARGEVLALLGENGAGKSTLVSILFGHYVADAGTIEVDGRPLLAGDTRAALAAGIGMVHQHFTLADNLSVLDNVMLGSESLWQPFSRRSAARARLLETARRFGLTVNPAARVADLSVGERQRVEILKALSRGARILILDEPTAVLTPQECESLFATLRQLVADGLSVIFISHKLDEVLAVSHRIAVLRGGRLIADLPAAGADKPLLAEAMVGRPVAPATRRPHAVGDVCCRVDRADVRGDAGRPALHEIALDIRRGEVVAIAGVAGNGQRTLADLLHGLVALDSGALTLNGRTPGATPRAWIDAGVARIPEDRQAAGVIGDLPLWENAIVERFDVRGAHSMDNRARALSGGNMQKLILGRALTGESSDDRPSFIVADQPTWGLDIGAVAYVHQQLLDAAAAGAAVLVISEDLDEIFVLADRIGVMHQGRLTPLRPAAQWTLATIGLAMAGVADSAHATRATH